MKRFIGIVISLAMILSLSSFSAPQKIPDDDTLLRASQPVINAYGEFDYIKDAKISGKEVKRTADGYYVDYMLDLDVMLKYNDAAELPHIKGLMESLGIDSHDMSAQRLLSTLDSAEVQKAITNNSAETVKEISTNVNKKNIAVLAANDSVYETYNTSETISELVSKYTIADLKDFISEIQNEYIGQVSSLSVGMRTYFDNNDKFQKNQYLYMERYVDDISAVIPESSDAMYKAGVEHLEDTIRAVKESIISYKMPQAVCLQ